MPIMLVVLAGLVFWLALYLTDSALNLLFRAGFAVADSMRKKGRQRRP